MWSSLAVEGKRTMPQNQILDNLVTTLSKERGVSQAKFDSIENAARQGYFVTGVMADNSDPDFLTSYEAQRAAIIAAKGGK